MKLNKKIITVGIITSMLMTGAVSAASMWGTYKGNDVIRITSSGVTLKTTDVPAISYNGRTMIPISMLSQVGLGYTWDQKNKTLDVVNENSSKITPGEQDLLLFKEYAKIVDFYYELKSLGVMITDLSTNYSLVYNEIANTNTNKFYVIVNILLNNAIDKYNKLLATSVMYDDSDMNSIMKDYSDAIDRFKDVDVYISAYYKSKSSVDFDKYLSNKSVGVDKGESGKNKSATGYEENMEFLLNF